MTVSIEIALPRAYQAALSLKTGHRSRDLPSLQHANPDEFGICVYHHGPTESAWHETKIGDCDAVGTAQSVSKVINEAIARMRYPKNYADLVGSEASKAGYNDVAIDAKNRPVNGMMNFGAIANCILLHKSFAKTPQNAEAFVTQTWKNITNDEMHVNTKVYEEDKQCFDKGDYNDHVNAFLGKTPEGEKLKYTWAKHGVTLDEEAVQAGLLLFLRLCSLEVNAQKLAKISAVLEHHGTNPFTQEPIFSKDVSAAVSESMRQGGLYAETEAIAKKTEGIPSKSGISGALIAHGSQSGHSFAWGSYSPRLSPGGNSVQGVAALERFVQELREPTASAS